jgi:hypothetical protein
VVEGRLIEGRNDEGLLLLGYRRPDLLLPLRTGRIGTQLATVTVHYMEGWFTFPEVNDSRCRAIE